MKKRLSLEAVIPRFLSKQKAVIKSKLVVLLVCRLVKKYLVKKLVLKRVYGDLMDTLR